MGGSPKVVKPPPAPTPEPPKPPAVPGYYYKPIATREEADPASLGVYGNKKLYDLRPLPQAVKDAQKPPAPVQRAVPEYIPPPSVQQVRRETKDTRYKGERTLDAVRQNLLARRGRSILTRRTTPRSPGGRPSILGTSETTG